MEDGRVNRIDLDAPLRSRYGPSLPCTLALIEATWSEPFLIGVRVGKSTSDESRSIAESMPTYVPPALVLSLGSGRRQR